MKKFILFAGVAAALLIGAVYWSQSLQATDPNIVSRSGVHWHPVLEIVVDGEKIEIPSGIGIPVGVAHPSNIHTHDATGTLHIELAGIVRSEDTKLKNFFRTWGHDLNSFGNLVTMLVNQEPNLLLGEYEMQDGDHIILEYQ